MIYINEHAILLLIQLVRVTGAEPGDRDGRQRPRPRRAGARRQGLKNSLADQTIVETLLVALVWATSCCCACRATESATKDYQAQAVLDFLDEQLDLSSHLLALFGNDFLYFQLFELVAF